jgi:hypothetical protein
MITILFCISITACTSRKQVYMSKDQEFFSKNPEKAKLENGNIGRTDSSKHIKTENSDGRTYYVSLLSESEKIKTNGGQKRKVQLQRNSTSNGSSIQTTDNSRVIINKGSFEKNRAKSDKKRMKPWLIVLLIVLGVMVSLFITFLMLSIIFAILNALVNSISFGGWD